ncbi:Tudor-knot domain-containing protein [Emticicia sp. SJ17W-69]|uniref:Tudor-knot domain-containing protein n=1 Tax=Emticicia sp. SJ17W-69 TaxID=3421657 RepID=UPI003EBFB3B3
MKNIILCFLLLLSNLSVIAQTKTGFSRTWVFMVGVLEWADANSFASFEKKERVDAKIMRFFQNNGVPSNQIKYLKDQQATTKSVRAAFVSFLKQAQKGDRLFFYYCGHGYKNEGEKVCFANYQGEDWSAEEIVRTVNENFAGNQAFFTADCCNSGGLVKEVQKYPLREYVALSSVVPTDVSTGNWTFSNALLYGLQGKNFIDINNNGSITLDELSKYIDEEMAVVEGQKAAYFVPKSMKNWEVSSNISLKKNQRIGERVMVDYGGEDYMGFIEGADANNKFNVRFYSYTNNETDWVEAARLKSFSCAKDLPIGTKVQALSGVDKKWYPAKVIQKFSCLHYIHYDGYGSEWDEWISPENIKKNW